MYFYQQGRWINFYLSSSGIVCLTREIATPSNQMRNGAGDSFSRVGSTGASRCLSCRGYWHLAVGATPNCREWAGERSEESIKGESRKVDKAKQTWSYMGSSHIEFKMSEILPAADSGSPVLRMHLQEHKSTEVPDDSIANWRRSPESPFFPFPSPQCVGMIEERVCKSSRSGFE